MATSVQAASTTSHGCWCAGPEDPAAAAGVPAAAAGVPAAAATDGAAAAAAKAACEDNTSMVCQLQLVHRGPRLAASGLLHDAPTTSLCERVSTAHVWYTTMLTVAWLTLSAAILFSRNSTMSAAWVKPAPADARKLCRIFTCRTSAQIMSRAMSALTAAAFTGVLQQLCQCGIGDDLIDGFVVQLHHGDLLFWEAVAHECHQQVGRCIRRMSNALTACKQRPDCGRPYRCSCGSCRRLTTGGVAGTLRAQNKNSVSHCKLLPSVLLPSDAGRQASTTKVPQTQVAHTRWCVPYVVQTVHVLTLVNSFPAASVQHAGPQGFELTLSR